VDSVPVLAGWHPKRDCLRAEGSSRRAIEAVFPRPGDAPPEHRLCEHHIKRRLHEKLEPAVLADGHPIAGAFERALASPERWAAFVEACQEEHAIGRHPMALLMWWFEEYGDQVAEQVATRPPGGPHSTGPLEAVLNEVRVRIDDRAGSFTNRARLANLVNLTTVDLRTTADGRQWADRIRERIYLAGGHATQQRPHDDPKGTYSLLD
jgi:hypothetical protein